MAGWSTTRRRSARQTVTRVVAAATVVAMAATVLAGGLATTASAQGRYTDVTSSSHGAHKANIDALEEKGVFDGTECGARRFCPNDPAKRWAVAVWIVRVIDGVDPFPVEESRFADVDDDEWWMPYVERLADLGITVGCKQNPLRYCPHQTVTRARMASFLVRAFRLQRATSAGFTDTRGSVHEANIDALFASGITVGCRANPLRYCPNTPVSRAQMASLLNRGLGEGTGGQTGGGTGTGPITLDGGPYSGDTLLAASRGRTCAVRSDGGITCWGGDEGYLEHLAASGLDDVVALSTGDHDTDPLHTCAVHQDGEVSCWGPGAEGQLGYGDNNTYHLPVEVWRITDAVAVAAGSDFTCIVHQRGEVSCWGNNTSGQLGASTAVFSREFPGVVTGLSDAAAIAAGDTTSCVIDDDSDLWCWGWPYRTTPARITGLDDVVSVSIGVDRVCAVDDRGDVYCWPLGDLRVGQTSQRITGISDAVQVAVGDGTYCVLHNDGEVSCWGQNDVGQVGDGTTRDRSRPVQLSGITDAVDISVSAGSLTVGPHGCALRRNGSVLCWGGNEDGQLETGTFRDELSPRQVRLPARIAANQVPRTQTELLVAWLDKVVRERGVQFRGLWDAWAHIRDFTWFDPSGVGRLADRYCSARVGGLGCTFDSQTVTEISLDLVRDLVQVYDLHTGLAPGRAWGAVQLYFATTYPDCFATTSHPGAEILADTVMHLILPSVELTHYGSTGCPGLPSSPTPEAERVVRQGMVDRVPDWYTTNITDGAELWTAWLRDPSLPVLANLSGEFGGLCRTDWITYPLDPNSFPSSGTDPFRNGGC